MRISAGGQSNLIRERADVFFLTTQRLWLSGMLVVVLPTILAMAGPILVRRRLSLDKLSSNNEVAGFKFATVGVLYAVLLAFAVIVVWERLSDAEKAVAQEAGAAVTIYRLADGVGAEPAIALRDRLTGYLTAAVAEDWPAMARGRESPIATHALDDVYAALLTFTPGDNRGAVLLAELLHQLDEVTQARRARLVLAAGVVPKILWLVLFGGAFVTIGFTFFFGTESLRAQTVMTGVLSLLIFAGLFVIISTDYPFAGSIQVRPEALSLALEDFGPASH
jgi:Protein of unknown function (DUF4239)